MQSAVLVCLEKRIIGFGHKLAENHVFLGDTMMCAHCVAFSL